MPLLAAPPARSKAPTVLCGSGGRQKLVQQRPDEAHSIAVAQRQRHQQLQAELGGGGVLAGARGASHVAGGPHHRLDQLHQRLGGLVEEEI